MTERTDYDSPWKNVLEHYLPDFMAFFFPIYRLAGAPPRRA